MNRMIVVVGAWVVGLIVPVAALAEPTLNRFEFSQVEMAVPIKIVLYAPDSATATRAAHAAFASVHQLNAIMSDYDPQSELRQLCETAIDGHAIAVSPDLWTVLSYAEELSARSDGAFDVTVGPVVRLWRRARRQNELPSDEAIAAARALVGYRLVHLDAEHKTVALEKTGMRLDLGGIAKGYAMDQALAAIIRCGIRRAMVEAGGDIRLGDAPPDKSGWRIGITLLDTPAGRPISYLVLSQVAVSTSGDSIQFVQLGDKRYSHVVDPRTGRALTDHNRVMVVAPSGITADGVSKAVGVLGPQRGLEIIDQMPGAAAMVERRPNDKVEHYESSRWKDLPMVRLSEGKQ